MFRKLCFLTFFVLVLSLAATSYGQADPCVIGNWEGSMDGWIIDPCAPPGTTVDYNDSNGVTLDGNSLKVYAPEGGWQQAISIDLNAPDVNMVKEFFERASFSVDVTRLSAEWEQNPEDPQGEFCGVHLVLQASSSLGDVWEDLGGKLFWSPGDGDSTKLASWDYLDLKEYIDPNSVTVLKLILITNYDPNFTEPGNYYFDNAQLLPYALKLDFQLNDAAGETEGGFTSFIMANSGDTIGGIKVVLGGNLQSRRRDVPTGAAREQIYRDFIFGTYPSGVTITLTGFGANQECIVTIYSYDWYSSSSPPRQAEWYCNDEYIFTTEWAGQDDVNYPPPEGENLAWTAPVTADSVGKIVLEAIEGPDNGGDGGEHFAFVDALVVLPTSPPIPITSAYNPDPGDGQTGVTILTDLSWTAGEKAGEHDVYFGTSLEEVNEADINDVSGVYRGRQSDVGYPLSGLELHTTYYWRIDEVNGFLLWPGEVWSFTITDFISIDDFETYASSEPEGLTPCPYYTSGDLRWVWLDGHVQKNPQGDCGGDILDYNPLAVQASVGRLPGSRIIRTEDGLTDYGLSYYYNNNNVDNTQFPPEGSANEDRYSEILRYYPDGVNLLTANGKVSTGTVPAIEVSYIGSPANAADSVYDRMYMVIEDMDVTTSGTHKYRGDDAQINNPDTSAAQTNTWTQWAVALSDFTDKNSALDLTRVRSVRIGFGKRFNIYNATPGGEGTVIFDNLRLYGEHCVLSKRSGGLAVADYGPVGNPSGDCVIDYEEIAIMGDDWLATDAIIETNDPGTDSLIAYWPMNEGTGEAAEDVVGDHNGALQNGVSWLTSGVDGNCINVDGGAGSLILIPEWDPYASGEMTIALWVRWAGSIQRPQGLVCQREGWGSDDVVRFMFEVDTGNGTVQMRKYGGPDLSTDTGVMNAFIGVWAHLAVTWDGTEAVIYVNGQAMATGPYTPSTDPNSEMTIGNTNTPTGWGNCPETFNGDIDEVRIYNRALSGDEVAYLADLATDPGDGTLHVPVPSSAELYEGEPEGERLVNFRDYAMVAEHWLEQELWP